MINEIAMLILAGVLGIKITVIYVITGISVGVGAFLHGYIPQEFFMKYMSDNNLFATPLAVIAGIPLYADATTIIPIAQVLIQKGAAIGTVLIFMMAVVGLSLPEMIILSRVMKKRIDNQICNFYVYHIYYCPMISIVTSRGHLYSLCFLFTIKTSLTF